MKYRQPTIEEQGGLKKWLLKLNINYELFKQLRKLLSDDENTQYTAIANALTKDRLHRSGKSDKISPRSVKHWFQVDDKEILMSKRK